MRDEKIRAQKIKVTHKVTVRCQDAGLYVTTDPTDECHEFRIHDWM